MKLPPFFLLIFITTLCFAQKHDNIWLGGYSPFTNRLKLDFNFDPVKIDTLQYDISSFNATYTISDKNGDLQFFTNGLQIYDKSFQLMEKGDSLNYDDRIEGVGTDQLLTSQGILILPNPIDSFLYHLFQIHQEVDTRNSPYFYGTKLKTTIVDMRKNNGLGAVVTKNRFLEEAQIGSIDVPFGSTDGITATKHGNGRDWWILMFEESTNNMYRYLLSDKGTDFVGVQKVDSFFNYSLNISKFSPDGSKYVKYNGFYTIDTMNAQSIDLYDFDRCTGLLSNHKQWITNKGSYPGYGVAFSPNSRFFYVSNHDLVWQFDTYAPDWRNTRVNIVEPGSVPVDVFPNYSGMQLTPHGEIFIYRWPVEDVVHIIHKPNEKGVASDLETNAILLPARSGNRTPNHPNYRLGALPCSSCDTLRGIVPLAITQQPTDIDLCKNTPLHFETKSNQAASFQWYVADVPNNWAAITDGEYYTGSTTSKLQLLKDATAYESLQFRCELSDSCTIFQSEIVELFYGQNLPIADFDLTQIQDSIVFQNQSTDYQELQWFYDNQTGSLNDFSHVFSSAGTYEVGLITQNDCGIDTQCQTVVIPPLSGNFSINQTAGCAPHQVSTAGWANAFRANEFSYRFETNGRTQTYTGKDAQVVLDQPGIYDVTLEIKTPSGETFLVKEDNAIEVFSSDLTRVSATICPDESYFLNGINHSIPDDYEYILKNRNGCDSVVRLSLVGLPSRDTLRYLDLCAGDSYEFGNQTIRTAGIYQMTHTAANGCDSIERLSVDLVPQIRVPVNHVLCWGDSVVIDNQVFAQSGNFEILYQTVSGCDSILEVSVEVLPLRSESLGSIALCEGDFYAIGDSTFYDTGTYSVTLSATDGCDSLVQFSLELLSNSEFRIDTSICQNESVMIGNQSFSTAGSFEVNLKNTNGCDSLVTLTLEVLQDTIRQLFFETCDGYSIIFDDTELSDNGVYEFSFPTANFCDSTVEVHLTVFPTYNQNKFDTICQNERLIYQNDTLTQSGIYAYNFNSVEQCDSTVNLHLEVLDNYFVEFDTTIIAGETFDGNPIENDTTITQLFMAANGCDSLVVIHLTVETSSINRIDEIWGIKVFPNPVHHSLSIETNFETPEDLNIQLTDLLGRPIKQFRENSVLKGTFKLNISNLTSGIYLLVFNTKEGRAVRKVIKS